MKRIIRLALIAALIAPLGVRAQQTTMSRADGEVIGIAPGRFAVLKAVSGVVTVDNVTTDPGTQSARVDLQAGDRLKSIQGQPVAELSSLLTSYRAIPTGSEVTLLVIRSGSDVAVTFRKPAPQARMMAVGGGAAGMPAGTWATAGSGASTSLSIAGANIIENQQGMPEVSHRTSHPAATTVPLRTGDVITRINNSPIAALLGLQMVYDKLAAGAEVRLSVQRGGETVQVSFSKPADK